MSDSKHGMQTGTAGFGTSHGVGSSSYSRGDLGGSHGDYEAKSHGVSEKWIGQRINQANDRGLGFKLGSFSERVRKKGKRKNASKRMKEKYEFAGLVASKASRNRPEFIQRKGRVSVKDDNF